MFQQQQNVSYTVLVASRGVATSVGDLATTEGVLYCVLVTIGFDITCRGARHHKWIVSRITNPNILSRNSPLSAPPICPTKQY
eukprot:15339070-Ditylum_brightwellii.AAC.1